MKPHVRRAHLHIFRIGPGRREIEVKWLAPTPVNATGRPARTSTVVPVKGATR